MMSSNNFNGGFCGALQRAPPQIPQCLLRRLVNKDSYGVGKVKVMLRVADTYSPKSTSKIQHFINIDKKKRQITINDMTASSSVNVSICQDRGPMVAAPKMFAFDHLFTKEDQQSTVCTSALSDLIPAVLDGSDGCLIAIGYPSSGQSLTMLGSFNPPTELGAIPCAISWLYAGINERRQSSGARFSVRISALGISATKPSLGTTDLLASLATDSDDSPSVYFREDFLGGPTELRAPTAERAALFLDAALAGRSQLGRNEIENLDSAIIFTLHIYQYSLSRKGGVAGGRSRLHLIDLGGCANRNGGLPLSGISNVLLAILSGQRHPPNKDHPLTPLLKDCLAPISCHVTLIAHVKHSQSHIDALTTIQLASRIHRMRRRKYRFPMSHEKPNLLVGATGNLLTASSAGSGADPSSSELSADTVIYMGGPSDDATDGEHPPVYLSTLTSDERSGASCRVLKGTNFDKRQLQLKITGSAKKGNPHKSSQNQMEMSNQSENLITQQFTNIEQIAHTSAQVSSTNKIVNGAFRQTGKVIVHTKSLNLTLTKGSPHRRSGAADISLNEQLDCFNSSSKMNEEQWVDGPRISRAKIAEARHLMREVNHIKKCETWIDGPKSHSKHFLTASNLPPSHSHSQGYGFMDAHKKTMIRQWVENQTSQVFQTVLGCSSPTHILQSDQQAQQLHITTNKLPYVKQKSLDATDTLKEPKPLEHEINKLLQNQIQQPSGRIKVSMDSSKQGFISSESPKLEGQINNETAIEPSFININRTSVCIDNKCYNERQFECEEDQDSGPSEIPPALPLIEISNENLHRMLSRQMSRESLFQNKSQDHRQGNFSQQSSSNFSQNSVDCGLQVTEDDIARTMSSENPLGVVSPCGSTTFGSNLYLGGDSFSECGLGERSRNQFDQLARIREIFTSQLDMAEVTPPSIFFNTCDIGSVYSEPAYCLKTGSISIHSEPPFEPPNFLQTPSSGELVPNTNGIMQMGDKEQFTSFRHPDGAPDQNLQNVKHSTEQTNKNSIGEKNFKLSSLKQPSAENIFQNQLEALPAHVQIQLPLLPLNTLSEAYDSGQDSCTPRTSKHSGISRRAESGYHSVATARDSDESSFTSGISKKRQKINQPIKKKNRNEKSLCKWLMNPFTCTYAETEAEISDF